MSILAPRGADAGTFRGLDTQVPDAATAMVEAAKRGEGRSVIAAFSQTRQACLGCQQRFRRSFIEQFRRRGDHDAKEVRAAALAVRARRVDGAQVASPSGTTDKEKGLQVVDLQAHWVSGTGGASGT
ncbi:MAG: hypothetical protein KGL78_02785 [Burkholderiales bacterium]|nr:hypothetical protein [Burkholderiales bacterium]